jgi:hypothetical protein
MRKLFLALVLCTLFIAGFFMVILHKMYRQHENNITIQVNESDDQYRFFASFSRFKSRAIQNYIDAQLNTNHLFRNAKIDADVTLPDHTSIYVKSFPGILEIKLDKEKNDMVSYNKIKALGEQLKIRLAGN